MPATPRFAQHGRYAPENPSFPKTVGPLVCGRALTGPYILLYIYIYIYTPLPKGELYGSATAKRQQRHEARDTHQCSPVDRLHCHSRYPTGIRGGPGWRWIWTVIDGCICVPTGPKVAAGMWVLADGSFQHGGKQAERCHGSSAILCAGVQLPRCVICPATHSDGPPLEGTSARRAHSVRYSGGRAKSWGLI